MDASLFLTEVDHNSPRKLNGLGLRAYIVQQSLLFNKLIIGDSQFNNFRHFRQLIWDKENGDTQVQYPQDLWKLIKKGCLVPAIRNESGSLHALRQEHVAKNVEDVPSEEYTAYVEEQLGFKAETYNIRGVSAAFKKRVLETFMDPNNCGKGKISKSVAQKVQDYVSHQDILLFNSLRIWLRKEIENGCLTDREYKYIDNLVSGEYRYNIPIALEKNIDIPASKSRDLFPLMLTIGNISKLPPRTEFQRREIQASLVLSKNVLSRLPSEAIIEIKNNSTYYSKIVRALELYRRNEEFDFNRFVNNFKCYLAESEIVATEYMTGAQKSKYFKDKRKLTFKVVITSTIDVTTSALNLIPFFNEYSPVLNLFSLIFASIGTISTIRDVANQAGTLKGYILGRPNSMDKLYRIQR